MNNKVFSIILVLVVITLGVWLSRDTLVIEWEPYSPVALVKKSDTHNLILVNFSSDFCRACQVNKEGIYKDYDFKKVILDNDIPLFYANYDIPENREVLDRLKMEVIPVLAVFQFKDNEVYDIILLDGVLETDGVVEIIESRI